MQVRWPAFFALGLVFIPIVAAATSSYNSTPERNLLDVKVNVFSGAIKEGQPLRFVVGLINLGSKQRYDVNLSYTVKDENDNVIAKKIDARAIETTLSYVEKIDVPKTAKPGGYVIQVDASYSGFTASAIGTFALQPGSTFQFDAPEFSGALLVVLFFGILSILTGLNVILLARVSSLLRRKKE